MPSPQALRSQALLCEVWGEGGSERCRWRGCGTHSPFSVMIWGTSLAAGEMHWIWLPTTKPSISERSSKVQLTPAESSGTL